LALAKRIAPGYTENPKVAALVVAGSVGRGKADPFSDLELDVYYHDPPNDEERLRPIHRLHAHLKHLFPFEEDEWAEEYETEGVSVGISGFLTRTVDRYLQEVKEATDTAVLPQIRLSAIQHSIPLHGAEQVQAWQEKAADYPDSLTRTMIQHYLHPSAFSGWYKRRVLVERDDLLMFYDVLCRMEKNLLGALLGLNRVYLANPAFKWLDDTVAQFTVAPPRLAERLKRILRLPPAEGVKTLEDLLDETVTLVEAERPELDMGQTREALRLKRPIAGPIK
jgi:predicted nucleotidyltransferase